MFACSKIRILVLVVPVILSCRSDVKNPDIFNDINGDLQSKELSTIYNNFLKVDIKSKGAELSSLRHNGKEYLWQGDTAFWKHQSPILFPIVGRLVDHEFIYKGKTYPMKFHGFAWKNNFKVIEKSSNSITFELTSSDKIKETYPFDFILHVKYILKNKSLQVEYTISNTSNTDDLYFSLGSHPAFNCPVENGHKRDEYQLVFDVDSMPKSQDKAGGLFIDQYTQYFKKPGVLKLQDTTFNKGALVFNPNPFSKVTLVHKPSQTEYLSVFFKNHPYLGIWSAKNKNNKVTPFVCIEPWYGVADKASHNKDYTQKEGVMKLTPNDIFNCSFRIEIL
jgi:galactose mutarotase-like enzyme